MASKYKLKRGESVRPNGTFYYRWTDSNGKRQAIYASTLPELRKRESEIQSENYTGIVYDKRSTIQQLSEPYFKLKSQTVQDSTIANLSFVYDNYIKPHPISKRPIRDIQKTDIVAFLHGLRTEKNLSLATVSSVSCVITQILNIGIDRHIINGNPACGAFHLLTSSEVLSADGVRHTGKVALTPAQQKLFLDYLDTENGQRWRPIFRFALITGLRVGELTALRWEDINAKRKTFCVNNNLVQFSTALLKNSQTDNKKRKTVRKLHKPKTVSSCRTLPLTNTLLSLLKEEKQNQERNGIVPKPGSEGYIFLSRFGMPQSGSNLNRVINQIIYKVNTQQAKLWEKTVHGENDELILLPHFSMHDLRRTAATSMVRAKVPIVIASKLLGHSSIQTTADFYIKLSSADMDSAVETLDAAYTSAQQATLEWSEISKQDLINTGFRLESPAAIE